MKNYFKNKFQQAKASFKAHPVLFVFMSLMWLSVVAIFIRALFAKSWESACICLLSLFLFTIPNSKNSQTTPMVIEKQKPTNATKKGDNLIFAFSELFKIWVKEKPMAAQLKPFNV